MKYSEYQPRPDLLKDRIILITGAGDGIGRAAALSYALHGATVVLHGRTLNKLEVIYDEIEGLGAPQPAILPSSFRVLPIAIMTFSKYTRKTIWSSGWHFA